MKMIESTIAIGIAAKRMGHTLPKAAILPCQVSDPIAEAIFFCKFSDVGTQTVFLTGVVSYMLTAISLSALSVFLQVVTYLFVWQSNVVSVPTGHVLTQTVLQRVCIKNCVHHIQVRQSRSEGNQGSQHRILCLLRRRGWSISKSCYQPNSRWRFRAWWHKESQGANNRISLCIFSCRLHKSENLPSTGPLWYAFIQIKYIVYLL